MAALSAPGDELSAKGREIYWGRFGKLSESPLFGKSLGKMVTAGTMRNRNTVVRLLARLQAPAGGARGRPTPLEKGVVLTATTTAMRIGWIGTGIMGQSMCGHLLAAGHPSTVYSRTRAKAEHLFAPGAAWADSPRPWPSHPTSSSRWWAFPQDVRDVYFSRARPACRRGSPGTLFVDMTTTEPRLAREIDVARRAKGCGAVDAPVSGGDVGARNATLSIMVGGDADAVARVMPLFEILGKNIVHQGAPGAGQHTKMCNQIVIAGTMIGVCESLVYGFRARLDPERMLQSISSGAAGCWTLENLAPRVIKGNFDPGFIVEHFIKDMGIALDEAQQMRLAMPGSGAGAPALRGPASAGARPARHAGAGAGVGAHFESAASAGRFLKWGRRSLPAEAGSYTEKACCRLYGRLSPSLDSK